MRAAERGRRGHCGLVSWMLMILSVVGQAMGADLPLVPFPEGVRIIVIGEDLKVYGLPLMAYEFKTNKSIKEISEFYTSTWSRQHGDADGGEPYMETEIQGWKVLSRLERGHNITVQISENGIHGTHVLVGVSPLPSMLANGKKNKINISVPVLGSARVGSVVESTDKGKKSEVYWLESNDSVEAFLERYVHHHREKGQQVSGFQLTTESGEKVIAGTFQVNSTSGTYRYDVLSSNARKTHATVIWTPL